MLSSPPYSPLPWEKRSLWRFRILGLFLSDPLTFQTHLIFSFLRLITSYLGRPPVSDGLLEKAKALRNEGLSFRKIGKQLKIDEGTVRRRIKRRQRRSATN